MSKSSLENTFELDETALLAGGQALPVVCRLSIEALDCIAALEVETGNPAWSKRLVANEFQHSFSELYGARVDGALVAFMIIHAVLDEAHIMKLGVTSAYRRRGVGRVLIEEVLQGLYWRGAKRVSLEVRVSNLAAQSLYYTLGFRQVAVRKNYYTNDGEDALLLSLDLESFHAERGGRKQVGANY